MSLAFVGCACSVWAILGLPPLVVCVLSWSTLLRLPVAFSGLCLKQAKAGPRLRALPRSKLLRFRFLGTPQRHRLGWACVLCPSQVQAAQVMRCLESTVTVTYCLPRPCHRFSWCTTGAPSQADVGHPESQEVLVSKEACLQFGRQCLSGAVITPFGSGCLSPEGDGQQQAISAQSFVL